MPTPKCEKCGNDGTESALYLAVDVRWMPDKGAWRFTEREDSGGQVWDCLACDHQTQVPDGTGEAAAFPYGKLITPAGDILAN